MFNPTFERKRRSRKRDSVHSLQCEGEYSCRRWGKRLRVHSDYWVEVCSRRGTE